MALADIDAMITDLQSQIDSAVARSDTIQAKIDEQAAAGSALNNAIEAVAVAQEGVTNALGDPANEASARGVLRDRIEAEERIQASLRYDRNEKSAVEMLLPRLLELIVFRARIGLLLVMSIPRMRPR